MIEIESVDLGHSIAIWGDAIIRQMICATFILFMSMLSVGGLTQGLSEVSRTEDPRLLTKISKSDRAVSIGELPQSIKAQTHIDISMDDLDDFSGFVVLVELTNVPAGDVLDALYALVSSKDGQWKWLRQGRPGAYSYYLVAPPATKDRARRAYLLPSHFAKYRLIPGKKEPTNLTGHSAQRAESEMHLPCRPLRSTGTDKAAPT